MIADATDRNGLEMKKKAVVVGSLLWKPFESRFGELLVQMRGHRRFIFEQLVLWHASEEVKERARAAADRKVESVEREDVALERDLAARERKLMREERDLNSQHRAEVSKCLREVRQEMRCLENDRKGEAKRKKEKKKIHLIHCRCSSANVALDTF